jgi:chromosome segregation ATPase
MKLTKEEFDYKKELAEIGKQISLARGELNDLKAQKDVFIYERGQSTEKAIKDAKNASFEALNAIQVNQDELISYRKLLSDWVDVIKKQKAELLSQIDDFKEKNLAYKKYVTSKNKEIEEITNKLKAESEILKSEKEVLLGKEVMLFAKAKDLKRREQTIKQAIKEYGITR